MIAYWPTNDYILNIVIIGAILVLGVVLLAWFIAWLSDDVAVDFTTSKPIGKVTDSKVTNEGLVIKTVIWDVPLRDAMVRKDTFDDSIFNCSCSVLNPAGVTIRNVGDFVRKDCVIHHTKEQNDILNKRVVCFKRWTKGEWPGQFELEDVYFPGPAVKSPKFVKADLWTWKSITYLYARHGFIPKWAAREVTGWMIDAQTGHSEPRFDGKVTIRVRFHNKAEYQKFRKYVLKTGWEYDMGHPQYECMDREFHTCSDLVSINKEIIHLLQLGFDVWTCNYQLTDVDPAELESPSEDDDFYDIDDDEHDEIPVEWS